MIYRQNVNIPSSHKTIEHNVASCIKCSSDNIRIDEYEDNFGYISTAKCRDCTHEIKSNTPISGVIIKWNEANDIPLIIADRERLIEDTKSEIKALKKLLNNRKRAK